MYIYLSNYKQFHYFQHDIYQLLYIQGNASRWWAVSLLENIEVNYWNKLKESSAPCWFLMHGISLFCEVICVFMYVCNLVCLRMSVQCHIFHLVGRKYSSFPVWDEFRFWVFGNKEEIKKNKTKGKRRNPHALRTSYFMPFLVYYKGVLISHLPDILPDVVGRNR